MGCSQYEVVLYQLRGLFSLRKNMRDGQWFLQMQWNEFLKELTQELDAKVPWLGKPCSVKHRRNSAGLRLCGKT